MGVRLRTTLVAVVAVGLVLAIAGAVLVAALRRSLTDDVSDAAAFRARAVAEIVSVEVPRTIAVADQEDEFVQLLDGNGEVLSSSANVDGEAELAPGATSDDRIAVPFEDDRFLVVAHRASTPSGPASVVVGVTLEDVDESVKVVRDLLIVGLPLLLLVVALLTWITVGRALRPVDNLRERVQAISADRLDLRVSVPPTRDEVARLATTMNEMLERLDSAQSRQRRFVSDASHELRSPVASIRQQAEVALAHPRSTATSELAAGVLAEDMRIQRLVDDLLTLARLDESMSSTDEVDVDDILFDEVRRLGGATDKVVDVKEVSAGRVAGDAKQLRSVIVNLLDNAVRHADRVVSVSLAESDGWVLLNVDDDGRGIAPEDRSRVFERFVRLDEARTRDSGGAGLGLAIVDEIVRAHHGRVDVMESPAGGARFRVSLPRLGV